MEMLRCKSMISKNGRASRLLESGTTLQLTSVRVDEGWRESWEFQGPAACEDLDVFLARADWSGREPALRYLDDGRGVLEWARRVTKPKSDRDEAPYVPEPWSPAANIVPFPTPTAHVPTGPEFNPADLDINLDDDEEDYARYFAEQ